jgi:Arc/MetJ-type ribon-helix-helix transcriptional regulator
MDVHLSADQQAFIREGIESGRLRKPEDAFEEAMSLWEERERRRMEILAAVDASEASLARGEGRRVTSRQQTSQLADDINRRGMDRLAAGNPRL